MARPLYSNLHHRMPRPVPSIYKDPTNGRPLTRLARELKKRNMSVMDLAKLTGLNCKYLYHLKDGTRKNPSWLYAAKIATALKVSPSLLFYVRH